MTRVKFLLGQTKSHDDNNPELPYIEGNYFNVHIHIIPRKYSFGGFELGTGLYVSSIEPKDIANKIKF